MKVSDEQSCLDLLLTKNFKYVFKDFVIFYMINTDTCKYLRHESNMSHGSLSWWMGKPSKSLFNVLRKSKKIFEKAAMSILRIIEQFIYVFLFQCAWKLILILIIPQNVEECTFKNKLIELFPYYWLTRFCQSLISKY